MYLLRYVFSIYMGTCDNDSIALSHLHRCGSPIYRKTSRCYSQCFTVSSNNALAGSWMDDSPWQLILLPSWLDYRMSECSSGLSSLVTLSHVASTSSPNWRSSGRCSLFHQESKDETWDCDITTSSSMFFQVPAVRPNGSLPSRHDSVVD